MVLAHVGEDGLDLVALTLRTSMLSDTLLQELQRLLVLAKSHSFHFETI